MVTWITIGGKERPLRFGMAALLEYERRTGRNANADVLRLQTQPFETRVTDVVEFTVAGLQCGYRTEGLEVDFELDDLADWVGDDEALITQIFTALWESLAAPKKKEAPALKATTTTSLRPGTGTTGSRRARRQA